MRLKKGNVQDYIEVHRKEKIWSSILNALKQARVSKMIILLHGQEVILFEEAEDLKDAYKSFENNPDTVKWDRMMTEWMESYPQFNEIKGDIEFKELPVVFYYENGSLQHGG
jgi:L-rhamnose mutarotase